MAEPCRIMLKQVAYNVFIGPLAVPILFELQHGLLKTGFSRRTPPTETVRLRDAQATLGTIGDARAACGGVTSGRRQTCELVDAETFSTFCNMNVRVTHRTSHLITSPLVRLLLFWQVVY